MKNNMPTVEEIAQQRAENAQAIKAKQEESGRARCYFLYL